LKKDFLTIAWNSEELQKLTEIVKLAHKAGVTNVRRVSKSEMEQIEPHLSKTALGAVLVPGEAVIDSWFLPIALAHQSRRLGAQVSCNSEFLGGEFSAENGWDMKTSKGIVRAKVVINAAGLYGDKVHEILGPSPFRIKPRKGQYLVYDKEAGKLIRHLLLPVPNDRTKGIIVFPTVYGNLAVGPTAEDVPEREAATTTTTTVAPNDPTTTTTVAPNDPTTTTTVDPNAPTTTTTVGPNDPTTTTTVEPTTTTDICSVCTCDQGGDDSGAGSASMSILALLLPAVFARLL